jgi:hypothetical protein
MEGDNTTLDGRETQLSQLKNNLAAEDVLGVATDPSAAVDAKAFEIDDGFRHGRRTRRKDGATYRTGGKMIENFVTLSPFLVVVIF